MRKTKEVRRLGFELELGRQIVRGCGMGLGTVHDYLERAAAPGIGWPLPEGPWSIEIVAFVAVQPTSGNVYDALAHVEYDSNSGQTIYVSYSCSTPAPFSSEVRLGAAEFSSSIAQPS